MIFFLCMVWGSHSGSNEGCYLLGYNTVWCVFFSWGGVRLSPLGTSPSVWPIIPAPGDRWWWMWSVRWNMNWQGNPKYSEETFPQCHFVHHKSHMGSNTGRRDGKPVTSRLSYDTARVVRWMLTDDSEEHPASIFSFEELKKLAWSR
jgi:hypothetical protein